MYDKPGISLLISSDADYPDLVVEIYWNGGLAAIIRKEESSGQFLAEYPSPDQRPSWFVGAVLLDELMKAIEQAQQELA